MDARMTAVVRVAGLPARLLLLGLIGAYRLSIGRLAAGRCRFHPTCSEYAQQAVRRHGAAKGGLLAAWRLLRCSPLTAGGLDPVPAPGRWRAQYDGVIHGRLPEGPT
jgi:hypothetical protein